MRVRANCFGFGGAMLAAGCVTASAQSQQQHPPQKPVITLSSLTAQGFEIKAALNSYLVLQKGKDVWLCYMLEIKSSCEPAQ